MLVRNDLIPRLTTRNFIVLFVATLGMVFLAVIGFAVINDGHHHVEHIAESVLYVAQDYTYAALILIGIYLFGCKFAKLTYADIGFRRCTVDWIIRAFILGVLIFAIRIFLNVFMIVSIGFERMLEPTQTDIMFIADSPFYVQAAFFVAVACVIPFTTEIFQRGILFAWLRRNFNFILSAVASAVIFGVLHIEIVRYAQVLVYGICGAYLYEKTRSIWPAVAFHMTINGAYVIGVLNS